MVTKGGRRLTSRTRSMERDKRWNRALYGIMRIRNWYFRIRSSCNSWHPTFARSRCYPVSAYHTPYTMSFHKNRYGLIFAFNALGCFMFVNGKKSWTTRMITTTSTTTTTATETTMTIIDNLHHRVNSTAIWTFIMSNRFTTIPLETAAASVVINIMSSWSCWPRHACLTRCRHGSAWWNDPMAKRVEVSDSRMVGIRRCQWWS